MLSKRPTFYDNPVTMQDSCLKRGIAAVLEFLLTD
jgi:hypothetical protein